MGVPLSRLCPQCQALRFNIGTFQASENAFMGDWDKGSVHTDKVAHQQDLKALKSSADGCHLCAIFYSGLEQWGPPDFPGHRNSTRWEDPIYVRYWYKTETGEQRLMVQCGEFWDEAPFGKRVHGNLNLIDYGFIYAHFQVLSKSNIPPQRCLPAGPESPAPPAPNQTTFTTALFTAVSVEDSGEEAAKDMHKILQYRKGDVSRIDGDMAVS
jgi:hypothetical protein